MKEKIIPIMTVTNAGLVIFATIRLINEMSKGLISNNWIEQATNQNVLIILGGAILSMIGANSWDKQVKNLKK